MEARNWIGTALIVAGMALQPVGWMFVLWLQIVSLLLIFAGLLIFITQKYIEKSEEQEFHSSSSGGTVVPSDIHDHSGWGSGGRSESWSDGNGDGGGDGD
jgi:hypothetical protein